MTSLHDRTARLREAVVPGWLAEAMPDWLTATADPAGVLAGCVGWCWLAGLRAAEGWPSAAARRASVRVRHER